MSHDVVPLSINGSVNGSFSTFTLELHLGTLTLAGCVCAVCTAEIRRAIGLRDKESASKFKWPSNKQNNNRKSLAWSHREQQSPKWIEGSKAWRHTQYDGTSWSKSGDKLDKRLTRVTRQNYLEEVDQEMRVSSWPNRSVNSEAFPRRRAIEQRKRKSPHGGPSFPRARALLRHALQRGHIETFDVSDRPAGSLKTTAAELLCHWLKVIIYLYFYWCVFFEWET